MATISLCMIVKNEENVLARCLGSIQGLVDEMVIVDTGSADATKEIAYRYTEQVYDFVWCNDFAAARNFAFSKCSMDYIYSADADEVLDTENRERFRLLKAALLPEVEIVQMKYGNQLQFSTIYNYDEEYRPKLYKRLRSFVWENPIHEAVRLTPVIYDSDVVITHLPEKNHAPRDLAAFGRMPAEVLQQSRKLRQLYARELFIAGSEEDFLQAEPFFRAMADLPECDEDSRLEACCVAAHAARVRQQTVPFFKYAMKAVTSQGCSEICCELGHYYTEQGDNAEAQIWYANAMQTTQAVLDIRYQGEIPEKALQEFGAEITE